MKQVRRIYCEGPTCEVWIETGEPEPYLPPGWIGVDEAGTGEEFAFCCWNCLMLFAANMPAPEEIPLYDQDADT